MRDKVSSLTQRQAVDSGPATSPRGRMASMVMSIGRKLRTASAVLGVAVAAAAVYEYKVLFPPEELAEEKAKKKVLVIPFHRLQLKDKHERDWTELSRLNPDSEEKPILFDTRDLVDLIHSAASDEDIVAIYGVFGHGSALAEAGWADLEEIRNALKVFKEVHRVHSEPNLDHKLHQVIKRLESKPLYAYSDTFSSLMDPGNREYYLASIFSHIHCQKNGELNLFGMLAQQLFLRDLLEKYGVKLHVFKHGVYKNAPNMFTEKSFTKAHYENVANILSSLNADMCADITGSRSKALLASWLKKKNSEDELWKRIHASGTFPAVTAWKAGLIDYLPKRDPLMALLESNKDADAKEALKQSWGNQETDFLRFKAEKQISLATYAKKLEKKKQAEARRAKWERHLNDHPGLAAFLNSLGVVAHKDGPLPSKEKVALLYVQGGIGDVLARKTVNAIRKIGKDPETKCVVVRVASPGGSIFACETISQELKGLGVPVVVSFGNVAASGGYYISTMADRVFASNKTVTGSIGVFGVRADLTGLAAQYGIRAQHIPAGDLSGSFASLYPMTKKMKQNYNACIDRYYDGFKSVVSEGRGLSMDDVEAIAQGRVWSGEQAKGNGLVDEIGGLYRAIAYARRNYTDTASEAEVVVWPKKQSVFEKLMEAQKDSDSVPLLSIIYEMFGSSLVAPSNSNDGLKVDNEVVKRLAGSLSNGFPGSLSGFYYAVDENTALRSLVDDAEVGSDKVSSKTLHPTYFWE